MTIFITPDLPKSLSRELYELKYFTEQSIVHASERHMQRDSKEAVLTYLEKCTDTAVITSNRRLAFKLLDRMEIGSGQRIVLLDGNQSKAQLAQAIFSNFSELRAFLRSSNGRLLELTELALVI